MIEPDKAELAVMEKAMDQGFLDEAYDLLWDHYGSKGYSKGKKYYQRKDCQEFQKDCSNLWMAVQPTDGQLFLFAVKKHIIDHSKKGEGNNAGDWMPSAANLAKHLTVAASERAAIGWDDSPADVAPCPPLRIGAGK